MGKLIELLREELERGKMWTALVDITELDLIEIARMKGTIRYGRRLGCRCRGSLRRETRKYNIC